MSEEGVQNYESYAWFGLAAPKGTPKAIVDRLNRETQAVIADPDIQRRLTEIGVEPWSTSTDDFKKFVSAEIVKWTGIIKAAGIKSSN
jgi:tripartite-type tricarboxylate transporter receptor subunit TctC